MKDIKSILKIDRSKLKEGLYGVEIEVEGKKLPRNLDPSIWRMEVDGSLKAEEALEYVTPNPLPMEGVKASLDYLSAAYKASKTVVDESIRAGVHVHMNVQDWNIRQLITFAMCYYILEDMLMKWCGPDREGNLFCLRTRDAEFVLFKLLKSLQQKNLKYLKEDTIRYSSLNYCSLFKYGSLEFRGMRGTGNLDTIYEWVKIIDELKTSSLQFSTPVEVIATMSGDGEQQFIERMFPTMHHMFDKTNDVENSVRQAVRRVQMIAYGVDWDRIGRQSVNPFAEEVW